MKRTIYKNICTIVVLSIIVTAAMIFAVYVSQSVTTIKNQVREQAVTMAKYLNVTSSPEDDYTFLNDVYGDNDNVRVTLITRDGTVIFDNKADISQMENHLERPEIIEAMDTGEGESNRNSETINTHIFYYAVALNDGNILRIAKDSDSVLFMGLRFIPEVILIIFVICIIAVFFAFRLTKSIMKPINEIDFDNINASCVYDELKPFFKRMSDENEEKEKTEQIRREFSANVSHELRTPLTTIFGYAQMISNGMARPEDTRSFGLKIEKEADRLILLINDIINLSRLDETDGVAEPEDIDLAEMTQNIIYTIQEHAKKKNVQIFFAGEKAVVEGNRTLVNEMIYNIIDNAIKYNKDNGRVIVFTGVTADGVVVTVKDTGIGIPQDDTERIFERFYRVDKSHSKTVGGTGLGLSIVKHAALVHNAKITVKSRLGKGTQISIIFPL